MQLNVSYLSENFADINTTNNLKLSKNDIEEIEDNTFIQLNNLEDLNLSSNKINQIRYATFNGLNQKLKKLNLSKNEIKKLDKIIFENFKNLVNLDISFNLISKIDCKENWRNLVILNLSNNKLTDIKQETFCQSSKLEILYLNNNQIEEIENDTFKYMINLKKLDLSCNKITELNFCVVNGLKTLNLSFNSIKKIKSDFFNPLNLLNSLNLRGNKIDNIQNNTLSCLSSVELIDLTNNVIEKINFSVFENLKNLSTLFFDYNKISTIENDIKNGLKSLNELSLSNNSIDTLDKHLFKNFINLTDLNLSNNKIKIIHHDSFEKLKSLKRLYLSNNFIDDVNFLGSMNSIEHINLFNNCLESIQISFDHLNTLNILELSNNQFRCFNFEKLPKSINKIYLDNNKIESISNLNMDINSIKILYLNGNNLNKINKRDLIQMIKNFYDKSENLTEFFLYNNGFNNDIINELKAMFKTLKLRSYYALNEPGYLKPIKLNDSNYEAKYPQLYNFEWNQIPMFSIITGKNGSGKSSILMMIQNEIIDLSKSQQNNENNSFIFPVLLKIHDKIVTNDGKLEEFKNYLIMHSVYQYQINYDENLKRHNFETPNSLGSSILSFYTIELAIKYLRNDLNNLNEFLFNNNFKYKVILNEKNIFFAEFSNQNNNKIEESNLSPGEKTILLFSIWKYIYGKFKLFGKTILLLDEPDSHLHPQAVNEIIIIIKQLVELGIQVVMTTHNPTTISLINNENLFLLSKESRDNKIEIKKAENKLELYKHLTPNNLINVENFYKIVLVEGKTDLPFYKLIHKQLLNEKIINDDILLVFQPLQEEFRSKSQVLDLIKKVKDKYSPLDSSSELEKTELDYYKYKLQSLIYAIVDDDNDKYRKNRINSYDCLHYLNRYSFENYLWDPFNLISYLIYKLKNDSNLMIKQNFKDIIQNIIDENQIKENKDIVNKIININVLNKIEDYIIDKCFDKIQISSKVKHDQNKVIDEIEQILNIHFKFNSKQNFENLPLIFQMRLNLYKIFDLYVNCRQTNPLSEFLDPNGYQFDPFKEYLRLRWMENYLFLERCPLTERFNNLNSKIINSLKPNIDLENIFIRLNKSFQFEKIMNNNRKEIFNQTIDLKDALLNLFLSKNVDFGIKNIQIDNNNEYLIKYFYIFENNELIKLVGNISNHYSNLFFNECRKQFEIKSSFKGDAFIYLKTNILNNSTINKNEMNKSKILDILKYNEIIEKIRNYPINENIEKFEINDFIERLISVFRHELLEENLDKFVELLESIKRKTSFTKVKNLYDSIKNNQIMQNILEENDKSLENLINEKFQKDGIYANIEQYCIKNYKHINNETLIEASEKLIKNILNKLILKYSSDNINKSSIGVLKKSIDKIDFEKELTSLMTSQSKSYYFIRKTNQILDRFNIKLDEIEVEFDVLILVRECINDYLRKFEQDKMKKTMEKCLKNYLKAFQDYIVKENEGVLDKIKDTILQEYIKGLKEVFKIKSSDFEVEFHNQKFNYSLFFFKMRGHDLEKIYHKIFLEQDSPKIFDVNKNNEIIETFKKKIELIIPNDLKKIFVELSSKPDSQLNNK